MLGQRPAGELLVNPENRVLPPASVRDQSRGDPRRQHLDRHRLQPPPAPQLTRPNPSGSLRTPGHHNGQPGRLTDVHQTGSTPDLSEGEFDGSLAAKDADQHLELLLLGDDHADRGGQSGERAVHDGQPTRRPRSPPGSPSARGWLRRWRPTRTLVAGVRYGVLGATKDPTQDASLAGVRQTRSAPG